MHFYAPEIKDRGAYCFDLSVFLSSSLKLYNLATGITFERWVLARALIIHMSIPCEKTFRWLHVSLFWTLWPWPWSLTHSLKILNLLINFEQWVLELSYCTWTLLILLVSRYLSLWPWQSLELAIIGGICVSQTHLVGN